MKSLTANYTKAHLKKPLVVFSFIMFILFCVTPLANAQKAKPPRPAYVSVISLMLNPEKIKNKIKEIESDKELEQGLKNKLLSQYRQAINLLEMATIYESYTLSYLQSLKSAPAEEEKINRLLRKMDIKPKVFLKNYLTRFSAADQERQYAIIQAELVSLKEGQLNVEELLLEQRARPSQIREELAVVRKALEEIDSELKSLRVSRENLFLTEARQIALQAARQSRIKEIVMLNGELSSYGPRIQLLTAQRELASRKLMLAQLQTKPFEDAIKKSIQTESEKSKASSTLAESIKAEKHPAIWKIAEETVRLEQETAAAAEGIQHNLVAHDGAKIMLKKVEQDFYDAKQKIHVAGFSKSMGRILLEQLRNLPDAKQYDKINKKLEKKIGYIWLKHIKVDEMSRFLNDLDREVHRVITESGVKVTDEKLSEVEYEIRELLKEQKILLGKLSDTYASYLSDMGDFEITQKQLIGIIEQYGTFMESRVLWIPNAQPFGKRESENFTRVAREIFSLSHLTEVAKVFAMDARQNMALILFFLLVLVALLWSRKRFISLIAVLGNKVSNPSTDNFLLTVQALFLSIILALPVPLLLGFVGWRLQHNLDATQFTRAIGKAFEGVSLVFFYMQILYFLCLKNGVAELHFQWDGNALKFLRKEIKWYSVIFLPSIFFIAVSWFIPEAERGRAGRLVFVAAMLALAAIIVRILKPRGGLLGKHIAEDPQGWLSQLKYLWYPSSIAVPLMLAVLAAWGYIYTAIKLVDYTFVSFWLIVGAVVANDLVIRWITVTNRKLALKRAEMNLREKNNTQAEDDSVLEETYALDVPAVSIQTRKLLNTFIGIGVIIGLLIVWSKVFPALSVLDQVSLWKHTIIIGGKEIQQSITLSNLALVIVLIIITVVFTRNIPGAMEIILLRYMPISAGSIYAITHLARYIIVLVGLVAIFQAFGGRWSQIQWLVAALGVGLGFGLQEIFGNLISGIIILFERPIRVGDTVTIGDVTGVVSQIRMRATTITDGDNKELIIPNKSFITGQLVNWTLTDSVTRVTFNVGVAYGCDTKLAYQTILNAVASNPLVLQKPEPQVSLLDFGESSLSFTVFAYAKQLSDRLTIIHELHIDIEKSLCEQGITIPVPQRDIHIRSYVQEPQTDRHIL